MSSQSVEKLKIVFLDAYTNNPGDISFSPIRCFGDFIAYDRTSSDQLLSRAKDAEILIVNKFVVNHSVLDQMPFLKYIVVAATGYNNIDVDAVKSRGIKVSNVRGYSSESVTQHVFASIFAIRNKLEYYDSQVKAGRWSKCKDFCFYDHSIEEISGQTMGIYGYGTIGQRVGKVANAFGMKVLVKSGKNDNGRYDCVQFVSEEELFTTSDIISLHCPLNDTTAGIINRQNLEKMKKNTLIINTGRGGLIIDDDLVFALDHEIIAGAALDVLVSEPPALTNALIHHPKCLITPHIAWTGKTSRQSLINGIAANIAAFLEGRWENNIY
jgi:glycerate dehydrogenase